MNKLELSLPIVNKNEIGKWNYVYILRCNDDSLYTGWTNDIKSRIHIHNLGQGAKYTKSRLPVRLQYWECFGTKSEALKRECQIKKYTRKQKLELILGTPFN